MNHTGYFISRVIICCLVFLALVMPQNSYGAENSASDTVFIKMVEKACFDFFWNEANPDNGLIKDRDTPDAPCSIASVGFGLSAICIAVDNGWITRSAAADRVETTLNTFWTGPQGRDISGMMGYKGLFYHFLDMNTGLRTWDSELSSIDTALLLAGILHTREYFDGTGETEIHIRQLADSIYFRADWEWMRNFQPNISLGWKPDTGFIFGWWKGYNEAMIMDILALGSPTHPSPASIWNAWTSGYVWNTYYGYSYVIFPPLFGHQYSHCWIDFRYINDAYMNNRGITYFENSRRATLAQREYCIANPGKYTGYGENVWGITASDGPDGYAARGAPPAQNDDGTIAPTAARGSIAFTPDESLAALKYMYDTYTANIWKKYGFRDAFNLSRSWWASDVIGIDEGAIIIMMENYRSEGVWKKFMQNEYIKNGLERAGFTGVNAVSDAGPAAPDNFTLSQNYPNPFNGTTLIEFTIPDGGYVRLKVFDLTGRELAVLIDRNLAAGNHSVLFNGGMLTSGIYYYNLQYQGQTSVRRMLLLK